MTVALLLASLMTPTAEAGDAWEKVREHWSADVSVGLFVNGDLTGNVRDIPRAYAASEVAGDLPMGAQVGMRNVIRYPLEAASPAILANVQYGSAGASGTFEPNGDYTRTADRIEVQVGPGVCLADGACVFAAYNYRQVDTADVGYPINNIGAALGEPEGVTVPGFTGPFLTALVGEQAVALLLGLVDFDSTTVTVDVSDVVKMNGGTLAVVAPLGGRMTVDASLGYFSSSQTHTMSATITDAEGEATVVEYDYVKPFGVIGSDISFGVNVLPDSVPARLSVGVRASLLTIVDMTADRAMGGYVAGGAFIAAGF